MGTIFKGAREKVEGEGIRDDVTLDSERTFVAFIHRGTDSPFTEDAAAVAKVVGDEKKMNGAKRVSLRTQVIPNPNQPGGVRDRFLQFFTQRSVDATLRAPGNRSAVIAEEGEKGYTPIAYLTERDVQALITGEGFAMPIAEPRV